jgi:tRNA pseudouridine13 synthase
MASFVSGVDTFVVEEIPAYRPGGAGEHTYCWIEKRDLTTHEALRRLARALGVQERDVGYAGLKDRHATTRQWLSLPGTTPEAVAAVMVEGVRVLEAARHGNKLRMGHLKGNRFEVVLTEVAAGEAARIEAQMATLAAGGVPNRFGQQRFGASGDNVEVALAVLRRQRREPDRRRRELLFSALQSAIFNRALDLRAADGLLTLREGDVLKKTDTGGLFVTSDLVTDAARVAAGAVVPTGPMPGNREIEPPPGSAARALEDEAMAAVGVGREELEELGRALPGARRPVVVPLALGTPAVEVLDEARLRLRFGLPAGSYATVVLDALGVIIAAHGRQDRADGRPEEPVLTSTPR